MNTLDMRPLRLKLCTNDADVFHIVECESSLKMVLRERPSFMCMCAKITSRLNMVVHASCDCVCAVCVWLCEQNHHVWFATDNSLLQKHSCAIALRAKIIEGGKIA